MTDIIHPVQKARQNIDILMESRKELQGRLRVYQTLEWQAIKADLESDLSKIRLAMRDYEGSDWRELGFKQGEWSRLERILRIPEEIRDMIQRVEDQIAKNKKSLADNGVDA